MADQFQSDGVLDGGARVRDLEEKQRLLKDRIMLVGQSVIDERGKTFSEIQDLKKQVIQLREDSKRASELLKRIIEQLSSTARKEELLILQRQLDLFRKT